MLHRAYRVSFNGVEGQRDAHIPERGDDLKRDTGPPTAADMQLVQSIYERHKGIFYQIAMARARTPADADNVVSEAILRLFRYAPKLAELSEKALVCYVADTVFSASADLYRRQRSEDRRLVSADDQMPEVFLPGPEEEYAERETEERLRRYLAEALEELPESDRTLLIGKYVHGRRDAELAEALGVKPDSVRMKLTRARNRARTIMARKEAADGKR